RPPRFQEQKHSVADGRDPHGAGRSRTAGIGRAACDPASAAAGSPQALPDLHGFRRGAGSRVPPSSPSPAETEPASAGGRPPRLSDRGGPLLRHLVLSNPPPSGLRLPTGSTP